MKIKLLILILFLGTVALSAKVAYRIGSQELKSKEAFTGQEFFTAINDYRKNHGLAEIELYPPLCDGLVERWQVLKDPDTFGHEGFQEWLTKVDPDMKLNVSEVSTAGDSRDPMNEVIASLINSPGHRLALEEPKATLGCAYAAQGTGVLEIAYPR